MTVEQIKQILKLEPEYVYLDGSGGICFDWYSDEDNNSIHVMLSDKLSIISDFSGRHNSYKTIFELQEVVRSLNNA